MERKVIHVFYDKSNTSDLTVLNVIEEIEGKFDSKLNLIIQPLEVEQDIVMTNAYGIPLSFEGVYIIVLDKDNNQEQCIHAKTKIQALSKLKGTSVYK